MRIEPLDNITSEKWDELIAPYDSRTLFHRSAWLDFLAATTRGRVLRCEIRDAGGLQGYFCALVQRKGLFNLLGSPLTGWRTDSMGPVVDRGFDQIGFLRGLDEFARACKIDFLQIGNPCLDPSTMSALGYDMGNWEAWVVDLDPDPEIVWKKVGTKCRNRIRKGRENGLVVEECGDAGFMDEFYSQLEEVFHRKSLSPPFSLGFVRALHRHLTPDNLFALRVRQGNETVAAGLFPHDDRTVSSFGIASRTAYLHLCPNELLNWAVMKKSAALGIHRFVMGHSYRISKGVAQFKSKFKCRREPVYRYSKSYSLIAKSGYSLYKALYNLRIFSNRFLFKTK